MATIGLNALRPEYLENSHLQQSLLPDSDVRQYGRLSYSNSLAFYRAMHFSAKRGIAITCRLSVRL